MDLTAQIYERARQLWDEALDIFLRHNLRVEGQVQNESSLCGLEGQHSLLHGEWAVIAPREKVAKFFNFTFDLEMLFGQTFQQPRMPNGEQLKLQFQRIWVLSSVR
jgi:hypothetical protein